MTRIISPPQRHALSAMGSGPVYRTELVTSALADCIRFGWAKQDAHGFAFITDEGTRMLGQGV